MSLWLRGLGAALTITLAWSVMACSEGRAGDFLPAFLSRHRPPMERDHGVERIAKEIDFLQHHIAVYGTIVAKQPDVWGQARLTKHRQEYELVTLGYLNNFKESLQGYIRRSDQSFLGLALALNSSGGAAAAAPATMSTTTTTAAAGAPKSSISGGAGGDGSVGSGLGGSSNPALSMIDSLPSSLVSNSAITRTAPMSTGLADFTGQGALSVEPTVQLSQLSRYLNYLHELRRINEGDDTADSPGYSLNLVRIPISIIPGNKTKKGYGAEVTITVQPYLSDELLPITMRNLIINDVVDQLGLGLTRVLEQNRTAKSIADANRTVDDQSDARLRRLLIEKLIFGLNHSLPADSDTSDGAKQIRDAFSLIRKLDQYSRDYRDNVGRLRDSQGSPITLDNPAINRLTRCQREELQTGFEEIINRLPRPRLFSYGLYVSYKPDTYDNLIQVNQSYATTRPRRSDLAFPPSQVADIFGPNQVFANLLRDAEPAFREALKRKQLSLLDVEAWLRRELEAAYDFLASDRCAPLWAHCSRELTERIRARARRSSYDDVVPPPFTEEPSISALRDLYFRDLEQLNPPAAFTGTEALSWAILVESAMLTRRLVEDMEQLASVKGCPQLATGRLWLDFYLPHPSLEARELFKQYVMCRWPIHVFALDPVTDEQNIADQYSRRRELQLALAVGVANGEVNANAAMRFMRRVEMDLETVSLNRTMVGFAYGDDTFGWRFYPRVQPPPTVGNGRAFLQTLTGRPTSSQDVQSRQLEPGMRECEAIVIMPSFVPYVVCDIRTNWFCLTHPGKIELSLHDAMRLSRMCESLQQQLCLAQEGCNYRPGDVARLSRVVQQLDRQMPLTTMMVQIPYENTLGGFEMFATGVTDLGPELKGFYGEPGVRVVSPTMITAASATKATATAPASAAPASAGATPATPSNGPPGSICGAIDMAQSYQCQGTCGGTTLFLVGRNFSIHDTKVIAGGHCVPFILMSREIMRVTIPNDVDTILDDDKNEWVDLHLATPYGVTSHLMIPAIRPGSNNASAKRNVAWDTTSLECQICFWPLGSEQAGVPGAKDFAVQEMNYLAPPAKLTATDSSDPVLRPNKARMQLRVYTQSDKGKHLLGDTRIVPVAFDNQHQKAFMFADADSPATLIKEVVKKKLNAGQQTTQLIAEAYLNYDQPNSQGLPVIKFDDPITIDVTTVTCANGDVGKGPTGAAIPKAEAVPTPAPATPRLPASALRHGEEAIPAAELSWPVRDGNWRPRPREMITPSRVVRLPPISRTTQGRLR